MPARLDGWCLDLGCAYGIATLAALENGAKIVAFDMEQDHIDVLLSKVEDAAKDRIKGSVSVMPDVTFEDQSFAAILCSRALHFLNGQDVEKTVTAIGHWLQPGGSC